MQASWTHSAKATEGQCLNIFPPTGRGDMLIRNAFCFITLAILNVFPVPFGKDWHGTFCCVRCSFFFAVFLAFSLSFWEVAISLITSSPLLYDLKEFPSHIQFFLSISAVVCNCIFFVCAFCPPKLFGIGGGVRWVSWMRPIFAYVSWLANQNSQRVFSQFWQSLEHCLSIQNQKNGVSDLFSSPWTATGLHNNKNL